MSSTEATNGISRRAVLAGAAAIGGTIDTIFSAISTSKAVGAPNDRPLTIRS